MKLQCHLDASSVYTIQLCISLQCHFIQSETGRVHVCSAVTCHLHFGQNVRDLKCATAVTGGGGGISAGDPGEDNLHQYI